MLTNAKRLIEAGFAVHLLKERSKTPDMGEGWSKQDVMTFEQLKRKYRPGHNLGVRLGKPSKVSGMYLHVVDMDIRSDEYAAEAQSELSRLFPKHNTMACVQSGSGGASRHFYFLCEEPLRSKKVAHSRTNYVDKDGTKHWHWEIELFGTGKQVALPPSIHPSGKPYVWLNEFDFDLLDLGIGPIVDVSEIPKAVEIEREEDADDLLHLLTPPKGLTLPEIADVLDALPLDEWCEDRDGWLKTGMAIHHETQGDDEAFDLWCDWSAKSAKFDHEDAWRVWKSFGHRASKITMGTLLKAVKDSGLSYEQCWRKLEATASYRDALNIVASYDFMPSEISGMIPKLVDISNKAGKPITKRDVEKDLKLTIRETNLKNIEKTCRSIEQWLADETLRIHYAGGKHLISCNDIFWTFNEGFWTIPDQNVVGKKVMEVIDMALGSGEEIAEPLRIAIRASGRGESTNAFSNAIIGVLRKACVVGDGEDPLGLCKEVVPSVMNCKNGEVWFSKSGFTYKKHNPTNYFTSRLNCEYDNTAECPEWDRAVAQIFSDKPDAEDVIRHLYEIMGYVLQPYRGHAAWILFHGQGQNGKSFITKVLCSMLGTKSWTARDLASYGANRNTHLEAGLVGKLMLIDDDFKKGSLLPDDLLKKYSEAKQVTANPKFGNEFNFICRTVPFILANHWPKTSDSSYGLNRRTLVFDFTYRIPDDLKDDHLDERVIENELPGILNHCIAGWRRVLERGRFLQPVSCVEAKNRWLNNRNAVSMFVSEHMVITDNDNDKEHGIDLFNEFQMWCNEENAGKGWGRNNFYSELENFSGVKKRTINNAIVFCGLRLKNRISDLLDDII